MADLDGDGKDDLLFERDGKRYVRKTPPGGSAVLTADALSTEIEVSGGADFDQVALAHSKLVDIDADGRVEVSGPVSATEHRLFRWDPGSEGFQPTWAPILASEDAPHSGCAGVSEPAHYADLNGDALPNLITPLDATELVGVYTEYWHYRLNEGGSFGPPVLYSNARAASYCYSDERSSWSMNLNLRGNNRGGLVVATGYHADQFSLRALSLGDEDGSVNVARYPSPYPLNWSGVFADLNGDGLPDWVGTYSGLEPAWNTGLEFRDEHFWPSEPYADPREGWRIADMDGDGTDNIVVMRGGPEPALILFRHTAKLSEVTGLVSDVTRTLIEGIAPGHLGDFNGDGLLDIASWTDEGAFQVHLQVAAVNDLVESVWDEGGYSARETIEYRPSNWDAPAAGPACAYPQRCMRQGVWVVRRHDRKNDGNRFYWYEDPRADLGDSTGIGAASADGDL